MFSPLVVAASLIFGLLLPALGATEPGISQQGTLHRRTYFYVGAEYSQLASGSIVDHGQIYVEHLVPAQVTKSLPLLLVHGHGMTGTNFLNTPDGRLGWADHFLSEGYEIYIIDQPARGRSLWQGLSGLDGAQDYFNTFTIESHFTATQRFNFWPQAALHTQWPGNGSKGDPIFDAFYASTIASLASEPESSMKIHSAGSQLLDKIGPVILITHSQSGQYGWILADARPSLVKAIIALEPIGPPFQNAVFAPTDARPFGLTEIPVAFSPPITSTADLQRVAVSSNPAVNFTCFQLATPRKLVNLAHIPTLMVTSESGYHSVYDDCSAEFLQRGGVSVKHVHLEDVGIHGNGHMMFMEKNGLQIAEQVVVPWLASTLS